MKIDQQKTKVRHHIVHRSTMRERPRFRRRRGLSLSRGCSMTLKRVLLERAIKVMRYWKSKGNVKSQGMALVNSARKRRRKRKVPKTSKRTAIVKKARVQNDVNATDHISVLPDCVIHNIMSFLHPREAARVSILSHRWRQVWKSFPQLDVDYRHFLQHGVDWIVKLKSHIDSALQNRTAQRLNIDKFTLSVPNGAIARTLTDIWIDGAIERNTKELRIQVRSVNPRHAYKLPLSVFSASTIAVLCLSGCNLQNCDTIKLPLLQKLSLKKLMVSDQIMRDLISGCPSIADMRLVECTTLVNVDVSALTKLQKFHLYHCKQLMTIIIAAPMLKSFFFHHGHQLLGSPLNLGGFRTLRELVLEYPTLIDGKILEEFPVSTLPGILGGGALITCSFPFLEKLVLSKGISWSKLQISGEKLIKLSVRDVPHLDLLVVRAPQLLYLEYKGDNMPITLVGPTSLKEVNLYVKQAIPHDSKYRDLLCRLRKCGGLKLLVYNKFEAVIQEDMSTIFPRLAIGADLQTIRVSTSVDYFVESLLKGPKYPSRLSVFSHEGSKFHETIDEKFNAGRKDPNCCSYFKNKCWKHHLRGFTCRWSVVKPPVESDGLDIISQPNVDWRKTIYALDWGTG